MQNGNREQGNTGKGKMRGGLGFGPGGLCRCPSCGTEAPHKAGIPCLETKCPKCGSKMTRAGR